MTNQKLNYQKELDNILEKLSAGFSEENSIDTNKKPSLLLHACCGPCSSYVLEYLEKYFKITVFYYNPNIYPQEEYERRFSELKELYKKFPPALNGKIQVVEKTYNPQEFYDAIEIQKNPELADEKEKGERCRRCYEFRLKATFDFALKNQFDYFCTTLSISPFKDAQKLNEIGEFLEKNASFEQETSQNPLKKLPKWLPSDFKKKGGFKRSLEISEEYSLYRQEYCGCVYSKKSKEVIK